MHDNFRIMGRGKKRQEFLHTKPLLHSASRMFQHAGETWGCVIKDTRLAIRRAGILFWLSHLIDKLLKFSLLYLNRSEPSTRGYTVHLFIHAGHLNRCPWLHGFTVWWETQMDWNSPHNKTHCCDGPWWIAVSFNEHLLYAVTVLNPVHSTTYT